MGSTTRDCSPARTSPQELRVSINQAHRRVDGSDASVDALQWALRQAASELLVAAGSPAVLMVVGAIGGVSLIAAAALTSLPTRTSVVLVIVGTVPFAVLAWTAIAPVLLLLVVDVISVALIQTSRRQHAELAGRDLRGRDESPTSGSADPTFFRPVGARRDP